jgi:hypothetical protein
VTSGLSSRYRFIVAGLAKLWSSGRSVGHMWVTRPEFGVLIGANSLSGRISAQWDICTDNAEVAAQLDLAQSMDE